jgi:MSHA pilin protein MshD
MPIHHKRQLGLSLIELVMFIVIMGVAVAGIIGVLNIGGSRSADPLRRKQAMLIAESFMEEVQLARFTACDPADPNASSATTAAACTSGMATFIGVKNGLVRPYANVADYATAVGSAQYSFARPNESVDRDVNGRPLGQDAGLSTIGNATLAGIRTTVALNLVDAAHALGPVAGAPLPNIISSDGELRVLQITVTTVYGTGPNDFIRLDGYRTRYAPNFLP